MAELVSMDVENNSTDEKKLFTVKKWNAVALWSYNIRTDMCAICRCNIAEPCIECQAKEKPEDQENCKPAWGTCGHAFHAHCISRWLKDHNVCPMDAKEWKYDESHQ